MPLFEFKCTDCGEHSEILVTSSDNAKDLECRSCGGHHLKKQLSVPSSLSGVAKPSMPQGAPCCQGNPEQVGCPGPGACCGQQMA